MKIRSIKALRNHSGLVAATALVVAIVLAARVQGAERRVPIEMDAEPKANDKRQPVKAANFVTIPDRLPATALADN